ncbi:MAG TPA: glycosyltransferase [Niallia sp.]|nr:glycosyltransferase [Niallia sp.]
MKISVIVPVYKVEKYLEQCIKSILNQSYQNLEIILINDGSPDQCGEICDEFSRMDERIKVIHKENGGLSDARNAGLDIASGDYIGFVDSDDWINKNMYDILINTAIKEGSDIVECKFMNVYDREDTFNKEDTGIIKTFSNVESLKNHFNSKYFYRCVWSKIYKKDLFKDLRFPQNRLAEDLFLTHELFFKAKKVSHINYTGYYYFIRPDSIMGKNDQKLTFDTLEGMMEQHKFICEKVPELKKYVDKLYFNCLLKCIAFIEKNKKNRIAKRYKNIVVSELNRDDIEVEGISSLAFMFYKISPSFFANTIELLRMRSR